MYCGIYEDSPEDVVSRFCRVCDYDPCMCGSRKHMSDREYAEQQKHDEEYFARVGPIGDDH